MAQDQSGEIAPDVILSEALSAAKAKYAPAPSFMARCPATGSRKQWLRSMNHDEAGAISQNFYLRKTALVHPADRKAAQGFVWPEARDQFRIGSKLYP